MKNILCKITRDNQYNFITTDGKIISDQWFDWVKNFYNGYVR